jgi:tetratricopeptide (TPR) repeat protein
LFSEAFGLRYKDPHEMLNFADLACRLAEALASRSRHTSRELQDVRGEAWLHFGNAQKVLAMFKEAEDSLANARAHLENGTGKHPDVEALLWEVYAGLRRNQRRFNEAVGCVEQAAKLHAKSGNVENIARSYVSKAILRGYMGEPEEAVRCAHRALRLLHGSADPHLAYAAVHVLAWNLIDSGKSHEAFECLLEAEELFDAHREPLLAARRTWLRGHLDVSLGLYSTAEIYFKKAATVFERYNLPYETAVVLLELGHLYALQDRSEDLCSLAEQILVVFKLLGIEREDLMARLLLKSVRVKKDFRAIAIARVTRLVRERLGKF